MKIPGFYGNFIIKDGSVRASAGFPKNGTLLTLGDTVCKPDYANSCNEFISLTSILFDGENIAAGALEIINSMGVSVGPSIFVEHFTSVGINL